MPETLFQGFFYGMMQAKIMVSKKGDTESAFLEERVTQSPKRVTRWREKGDTVAYHIINIPHYIRRTGR